jgi:hypothetical protein
MKVDLEMLKAAMESLAEVRNPNYPNMVYARGLVLRFEELVHEVVRECTAEHFDYYDEKILLND